MNNDTNRIIKSNTLQIMEILETFIEAFEYIKIKIDEKEYDEAMRMYNDVIGNLSWMQRTVYDLKPISQKENEEIVLYTTKLNRIILSKYQEGRFLEMKGTIQFEFIPLFLAWSEKLEQTLHTLQKNN